MFDVIIVWKLDRFSRNRYDSARHKATLRKYGVKVVSATEAIADGPSGILMESVLEGMAEYYKYLVKEKHEGIISKQIIRSATSIGANANEAVYGISKADFIAKLQISLKETAETEYWLRLLVLSDYLTEKEGNSLLADDFVYGWLHGCTYPFCASPCLLR